MFNEKEKCDQLLIIRKIHLAATNYGEYLYLVLYLPSGSYTFSINVRVADAILYSSAMLNPASLYTSWHDL